MAAVVISLVSVCGGQGHATVSVTVDGQSYGNMTFGVDDLREAIPQEDRETAARVILRIHAIGKTKTQFRNSLQSGLNINV